MDGWRLESGKNPDMGIVHSLHVKKYGRKIFRLQVSYLNYLLI